MSELNSKILKKLFNTDGTFTLDELNTIALDVTLQKSYLNLLQQFYPASYKYLEPNDIDIEVAHYLNNMMLLINECIGDMNIIIDLTQLSIMLFDFIVHAIEAIKFVVDATAKAFEDGLIKKACVNKALDNQISSTFLMVHGYIKNEI